MKSEENIFLLTNEKNYYDTIKQSENDIVTSFYNTINFYVSYSIENMNIKDTEIYYGGLLVVKNIFKLILLYTKNLEITIYHCQQAVYYYVEYISQITDREDNIFFNLSIKDAVVYVYTRTIFEIKKIYYKKNDKYNVLFNNIDIYFNNYLTIINNVSKLFFPLNVSEIKNNLINIIEKCNNIEMNNIKIFNDIKFESYDEFILYLESKYI